MFELENAIADWRQSLCDNDAITLESVTELEQHLRETIDSLRGPAINEHEAFVIATMRLGPANELAHEYEKVQFGGVWKKRLAWMVGGYLGGGVIAGLISGAASLAAAATGFAGAPTAVSGVASVVVMAACWFGLFYYLMSTDHHWKVLRNPIALVGILVLATLAGHVMGFGGNLIYSQHIGSGQFGESLLWRAYGSVFIQIGVFIACLWIMFRHANDQETVSAA